MVKHTQTIRWQIAYELFECYWPFCGIGAILGLQSATLNLKWSFSASYNYISRSAICKADLDCILFDEKWTVILKVFLHSDSLWAIFPSF